jgi:hypothetical protein
MKKTKELNIMDKNFKVGAFILGTAVLLLLSMVGVLPGDLFLLVLGAGFLGVYFLLGGRKDYGNVGFLIPGAVLLAIGAFALYQGRLAEASGSLEQGSFFFLSLSGAFWLVFGLHTFWFKNLQHGDRFWPVYPAAGLLLFFGLLYSAEVLGWGLSLKGLEMWNYLWVVILMGVGAWLMLKKPARNK